MKRYQFSNIDTLMILNITLSVRYTQKRYFHSTTFTDIWGLDGTKQGGVKKSTLITFSNCASIWVSLLVLLRIIVVQV